MQTTTQISTEEYLFELWFDRCEAEGTVIGPHAFHSQILVAELGYPISWEGFRYYVNRWRASGRVFYNADLGTWSIAGLRLGKSH